MIIAPIITAKLTGNEAIPATNSHIAPTPKISNISSLAEKIAKITSITDTNQSLGLYSDIHIAPPTIKLADKYLNHHLS